MKEVFVTEIFRSFQGEGKHIGRPCIFVRFFGCAQACSFCDSKYSVNLSIAQKQNVKIERYTFEELHQTIDDKNLPIVFTGGEPFLQKGFLRTVNRKDIEIESNGSIEFHDMDPTWCYTISPKLSNSGNEITKDYIDTLVHNIARAKNIFGSENVNLKFVVNIEDFEFDIIEIESFLQRVTSYRKQLGSRYFNEMGKIYLMPMGTDAETIKKGIVKLSEQFDRVPFPFLISPRLHILIYGNKMGV